MFYKEFISTWTWNFYRSGFIKVKANSEHKRKRGHSICESELPIAKFLGLLGSISSFPSSWCHLILATHQDYCKKLQAVLMLPVFSLTKLFFLNTTGDFNPSKKLIMSLPTEKPFVSLLIRELRIHLCPSQSLPQETQPSAPASSYPLQNLFQQNPPTYSFILCPGHFHLCLSIWNVFFLIQSKSFQSFKSHLKWYPTSLPFNHWDAFHF